MTLIIIILIMMMIMIVVLFNTIKFDLSIFFLKAIFECVEVSCSFDFVRDFIPEYGTSQI